jgi:hypothetical protein
MSARIDLIFTSSGRPRISSGEQLFNAGGTTTEGTVGASSALTAVNHRQPTANKINPSTRDWIEVIVVIAVIEAIESRVKMCRPPLFEFFMKDHSGN